MFGTLRGRNNLENTKRFMHFNRALGYHTAKRLMLYDPKARVCPHLTRVATSKLAHGIGKTFIIITVIPYHPREGMPAFTRVHITAKLFSGAVLTLIMRRLVQ